jgi:hypothetical protein
MKFISHDKIKLCHNIFPARYVSEDQAKLLLI